MRAFLAQRFPAYPDLSGIAVPAGDHPGRAAGLQDPVLAQHRRRASRTQSGVDDAGRLRAHAHLRRQHRTRHQLADHARRAVRPQGSAIRPNHARRQRRVHQLQRTRNARRVPARRANGRAGLVLHAGERHVEHLDRPEHRRHHQPVRLQRRSRPGRQRPPPQHRPGRVLHRAEDRRAVRRHRVVSQRAAVQRQRPASSSTPIRSRIVPSRATRGAGRGEEQRRPAGQQDLPVAAGAYTATAFWEMFNVFNVGQLAALSKAACSRRSSVCR